MQGPTSGSGTPTLDAKRLTLMTVRFGGITHQTRGYQRSCARAPAALPVGTRFTREPSG